MKSKWFLAGSWAAPSVLLAALLLCASLQAQRAAERRVPGVVDHLRQGRQLARNNKWAEAEREFRIARQQDPNSTDAAVGHAEALVQIRQPFDAVLELESFLRDHPGAARAHELYAVVTLSTSGDFLVAESELEKCLQLAPNNGLAWKSLGAAYVGNAKVKDGIAAYKRAVQLLPNDAMLLASLAEAYSDAGDKQEAGAAIAKAIKMAAAAPDSPEARRDSAGVQYVYAKYLLEQGRAKESIDATTRALAYNPRSAFAYYHRARAYMAIGDYKQAEADALQAFAITPQDKQGALLLIEIYRKLHDAEKVRMYVDLAQKLVEAEQDKASFAREVRRLLNVAEAALRERRYSEAIPPYEDLLKKVPTFYEAYFGVGTCYIQTGRLADAEAAFRKYLSLQPVSGDGHAMLGVLLLRMERGPEAVPELTQAIQIDPSLDEARKALASEYLRESKPEDALRTLRAARDTKDTQLIVMLASVLAAKGDTASALREVRRALLIQPDDPDALRLKQEILSKNKAAK